MHIDSTMLRNIILKIISDGDPSAISIINEHNANIIELSDYSDDSFNPLIVAAGNGHIRIVRHLLQYDSVIQNITIFDNEALRLACINGHKEAVKLLLQYDNVLEHNVDKDNEALREAAINGHVEVIDILLEHQSIRDHITASENWALRYAAKNGHTQVVRRLLEYDDVVLDLAINENQALREAARYGHKEIVSILLQYNNVVENVAVHYNEALEEAARNGHIEVIDQLLKHKAVVENIAAFSNGALRAAAENGHIAVVNRLLEYPSVIDNITAIDNYALTKSSENRHYEISYILANKQWPRGLKDLPVNLRDYIPAIRLGEKIVTEKKNKLNEKIQLLRWLQLGHEYSTEKPSSIKELYLQEKRSSNLEIKYNRPPLPFGVVTLISDYLNTKGNIDTLMPTVAELNLISYLNKLKEKAEKREQSSKERSLLEPKVRRPS
jgi:ankyrin repeat protein